MPKKDYYVLAYYCFTPIEDPELEVKRHKDFFNSRDVKSRIYISKEGINGQMSALACDAEAYMEWMQSDPRFACTDFKIHPHHENVFPRVVVKVRKQLVAMDASVEGVETGEHVSPAVWKEMLQQKDENTLILDVRNDYEWKVGHFEGAELPDLEQFREFPEYAKSLKETKDLKQTKVMMYCTGGIRCELYSALLKKEGFEQVYQLQGGVIGYGLQEGSQQWKGKLFVFDDRMTVPIAEGEAVETISDCHYCKKSCDIYYNCANMDCNELFLCCPDCAEKHAGCCCEECISAPRVRAFQKSEEQPKPFRRVHECT